jgi:hypothetical protein
VLNEKKNYLLKEYPDQKIYAQNLQKININKKILEIKKGDKIKIESNVADLKI